MKVAMVTNLYESVPPHSKNGLEYLVYYLTRELIKNNIDVSLFATKDSHVEGTELISLLPKATSIDPNNKYAPPMLWEGVNTLYAIDYANNTDVNVIHLHHLFPDIISKVSNKPIVRTFHHNPFVYPHDGFQVFLKGEYVDLVRKMYERRNLFNVFVSKRQMTLMKEYYQGANKFNDETCTVIYNGIPMEDFTYSADPSDWYIYYGYINENKGAHLAVQIARKMGIKLKIAGQYNNNEEFFNTQIKPYLDENIVYVGSIEKDQRSAFLGNAKALLFPLTWDEPFGLTVVEAMACGTPVVAYAKGAMSEIIQNGKNGFIAENEEDFINCVKNIDSIKREDCRGIVEERFSVKEMTKKYIDLYKKIPL